MLADDLLGRVAEDPLGPPVPARDDAVEVLRDDDVVGRLDDGREPLLQSSWPARFSVTSRPTLEAPTISPSALRMGETVSETSMMVPSFRRRLVS